MTLKQSLLYIGGHRFDIAGDSSTQSSTRHRSVVRRGLYSPSKLARIAKIGVLVHHMGIRCSKQESHPRKKMAKYKKYCELPELTLSEEQKVKWQGKQQRWVVKDAGSHSHPEACDRSPRFLFRGHSPRSGNSSDSERWRGLNTPDAIVPHAFLDDPKLNVCAPWDVPNVHNQVWSHIWGQYKPLSEFSSWSHQLCVSLYWGTSREDDSYISVIDRTRLPPWNMTFLIDDLRKIDVIPPYCPNSNNHKELRLDFEYLVHGPVRGDALLTAKLNDLWMHGFDLFRFTVPASTTALQRLQVSDPSAIHSAVRFARIVLKDAPQTNPYLFYFLAATCLAYTIHKDTWYKHHPSDFTNAVQSTLGEMIPANVSEVFYTIAKDFQSADYGSAPSTYRQRLPLMVQFNLMRTRGARDDAETIGRALARLGDKFPKPEVSVKAQAQAQSSDEAAEISFFEFCNVPGCWCKPIAII